MKKLIVTVVLGMLIAATVFAQHEGFGIGIIAGGAGQFRERGDGVSPAQGNLGLSLKIPNIPIFFGFYGNLLKDYPGFGATADFYFIDVTFYEKNLTGDDGSYYPLKLGWYLGAGLLLDLYLGKSDTDINFAARVPVGISWYIIKPLELYAEIAPNIGVTSWGENACLIGWSGHLGLRLWFN